MWLNESLVFSPDFSIFHSILDQIERKELQTCLHMSSVSSLYRRYLLVCSKWSIDTTKSGRDFGTHLRELIPKLFPNSELTSIDSNDLKDLEKQIESLERLNKNVYFKPTFLESSASGLTADDCKTVLSTKSLQELEHIFDSSALNRLKRTLGSIRFLRTQDSEEDKSSSKSKTSTLSSNWSQESKLIIDSKLVNQLN